MKLHDGLGGKVRSLCLLLTIIFISQSAALAENRILGKFGKISPAAYDKPWYRVEVFIYIAPEIKTGEVSASFLAGGKKYTVGPSKVTDGIKVEGGDRKGWQRVSLFTTSKTGMPDLRSLEIFYNPE